MYLDPKWKVRLAAVDRAIHNSKSIWAIEYWQDVRRQLVQKITKEAGIR
jgi:hypothetical protein